MIFFVLIDLMLFVLRVYVIVDLRDGEGNIVRKKVVLVCLIWIVLVVEYVIVLFRYVIVI